MNVLTPSALAAARAVVNRTLSPARFRRMRQDVAAGEYGPVTSWAETGNPFAGRLDAETYDEVRDGPELHAEQVLLLVYPPAAHIEATDRVKDLVTGEIYEVVRLYGNSYPVGSVRSMARVAGPLTDGEGG